MSIYEGLKKHSGVIAALIGLLGALVPWFLDLKGRSLEYEVVSQTSLLPSTLPASDASLPKLSVTLHGTELKSPFVTVIRLTNNGTKPITKSEMESNIVVEFNSQASLASDPVTDPPNLNPVVYSSSGGAEIAPLLLNPNDTITLVFITHGGRPGIAPEVNVSARIAGIRSITRGSTTTPPMGLSDWGQYVVGGALFYLYLAFISVMFGGRSSELSRVSIAIGAFASLFGAGITLSPLVRSSKDNLPLLLVLILCAVVLGYFAIRLNRRMTLERLGRILESSKAQRDE